MVDACGIEAIFAEIGTPTTDLGQYMEAAAVLDVCTGAMRGRVLTSYGGEKAREQFRPERDVTNMYVTKTTVSFYGLD